MDPYTDFSERTSVDFVLFAISFLAFMFAVAGIEVGSPSAALAGGLVLLVSLLASS